MAADLTAYNAALKRVYHPGGLEEQLFQGNELLDWLNGQTKYKAGENHRVTIHTSRNGGTTFLPDGGGTLNAAGNQGMDKADYKYAHMHQQVKIEEDTIEATASDAQAVAEVVDTEVGGALDDLRKQITRTLFGNGDALICGVRTANSATIDLELLDGFNAVERGWLFAGLPVDVGTTANATSIINGETILSVKESETDPEITVTTTANVTAGTHFVSLKGSRSGASSREPNGLRSIVSTSAALGGLAATGVWVAAGADTTAQALTLSLMLRANQKINQKTGEAADMVLTGLKQERRFYEQLEQKVRYSSDANIDAGNADKATFHRMEVMAHPDCPNEDMYFGRRKFLFPVASRKPFWQNTITGGNILSWIQGTSSYGAKIGYHMNFATNRRNAWFRYGGLT